MIKVRFRRFHPALLLAFWFSFNLAFGQDPVGPQPKKARTPADYQLRMLKEIAELGAPIAAERDDERKGDASTLTHGNLLPSRVRVTFKGATRPALKIKKEVISYWSNKYAGAPQHYISAYTTEVLFSEAGINHWLVVNKRVVPRLKRELKKGRAVDLYLIRMGAYKIGDEWRWVLLVEDFAAVK
ncbi:MAG TPA: hypothetical protein VNO50_02795 [Pyrinomonadaceae bacterium]|nr:hypothetical protein [Pyrinomonadaceae bacterium]